MKVSPAGARKTERTQPSGVLYVCTGNTCRSPMAEALTNFHLKRRKLEDRWFVFSAGTAVFRREPAAPEAVRVMKERGIDITAHRSRDVHEAIPPEGVIIACMTAEHVDYMKNLYPERKDRIFRFFELVYDAKDGERKGTLRPGDIPDPYGLDMESYRLVAELLDRLSSELVDKLATGFEEPPH